MKERSILATDTVSLMFTDINQVYIFLKKKKKRKNKIFVENKKQQFSITCLKNTFFVAVKSDGRQFCDR